AGYGGKGGVSYEYCLLPRRRRLEAVSGWPAPRTPPLTGSLSAGKGPAGHVRGVGVGGGGAPGGPQARRGAVRVARGETTALAPVRAWTPPGGALAARGSRCQPLRKIWKQAAWDRLWQAIDLAIGGPPADLDFSPAVIRGEAGLVLTDVANQPGDVLVIG